MAQDRLTVVIAARNEEQALPRLHQRLRAVLDRLDAISSRVLYIDDGSTDRTWEAMQALAADDAQVELLRLSRNFGKEAALTAGLDLVAEDSAVMILDADGQDPPELIPQFVSAWREGHDNVFGTRVERDGEGWLKRFTAHGFYRLIGRLSKTPIPADTGDFRLLSPRAHLALRQLRERHRFMKGLFGWVGYGPLSIPYHRQARIAGRSKFGAWKLWNFALEGITSFSTAPLRAATYLGLIVAVLSFVYAVIVIGRALAHGDPVAGWPSMMTVVLFLGGTQLIALGLIGEYLGRLYEEAKQRPLYLVQQWQPAREEVSFEPTEADGARHAHSQAVAGGQDR